MLRILLSLLFSIGLTVERSCDAGLYYGEYRQFDESIRSKDNEQYSYKTLTRLNHPPINKRRCTHAMFGSLNGLVCFSVPHDEIDDPVYICNPITGEYTSLPHFMIGKEGRMVSGFGYHHSTDEYKIVRIYYPPNRHPIGQLQVYTLGGGSGWRVKGEITHSLCSSPGILVNGALHWMGYCKQQLKIVAFDLEDEEFQLLPSPPCLDNFNSFNAYCTLLVLGEHLSLVHHEPGYPTDIWSLKKEKTGGGYDMREPEHHHQSWSRKFNIPLKGLLSDRYDPFTLTERGKVLLWYNEPILSSYDSKTTILETLVDAGTGFKNFQAIPHVKSLVSLKALGEKSKRRMIITSAERSIGASKEN